MYRVSFYGGETSGSVGKRRNVTMKENESIFKVNSNNVDVNFKANDEEVFKEVTKPFMSASSMISKLSEQK